MTVTAPTDDSPDAATTADSAAGASQAAEPDGAAAQNVLAEPPRPSDEHIADCAWCWSFWERTLEADRWIPVAERPRVVGDGPPCPHCGRTAYQLRRYERGKAPQRLDIAVCFGCGHTRGLTEGISSHAAAAADANSEQPPAAETPRFVRQEKDRRASEEEDPEEETVFSGLRTIQTWELALLIVTMIVALLIWNIFIFVHGAWRWPFS